MTYDIGLGCWPLSGEMRMGGRSAGYTTCAPGAADRILHAAHDHGIRIFDTAQAYGCGHGERLLGAALKGREATIITKIGLAIDETKKEILGPRLAPEEIRPSVEESLTRLGRARIDIVLLHPNEVPIPEAEAIFSELEALVAAGKIGYFGWSTDYPERAAAQAAFPHARHVEHVMNVFLHARELRAVARGAGLTSLIRSPLAMGVLAGRFGGTDTIAAGDVRVESHGGMDWFEGNRAHPRFAARLDAVRELLQTGGRTLSQGALSWLLAQGPGVIPVPGASRVAQVVENATAAALGPLPADVMAEIAALVPSEPWGNKAV